jgi:hypothetical protein
LSFTIKRVIKINVLNLDHSETAIFGLRLFTRKKIEKHTQSGPSSNVEYQVWCRMPKCRKITENVGFLTQTAPAGVT